MERVEHNRFSGHKSPLMGAIFMCNLTTKDECFKRKLFGLPANMGGFVKCVKPGMLLFLFEHENRKLYGVYEATSDGAMNIVPNAYSSFGNQYPAQVRFKVIWSCKPLCEDEFCDAIKENYFLPNKFNFGLSYEQVLRLIWLFSAKKTRPGPYIKVSKSFANPGLGKSRLSQQDRSLKFDTNVDETEHDIDIRYPGSAHKDHDIDRRYPDSAYTDHDTDRMYPDSAHTDHDIDRMYPDSAHRDNGIENRYSGSSGLNIKPEYDIDTRYPSSTHTGHDIDRRYPDSVHDHDIGNRYSGSPGLNANYSYYEKPNREVDHGHMTHPAVHESHQPVQMPSTSQADHSLRVNFPDGPSVDCRYFKTDPRLETKQPTLPLGMDDPSLAQKRSSPYTQYPLHLRTQSYPSDPTIRSHPPNRSMEGLPPTPHATSRGSVPSFGTEGYTNVLDYNNCSNCYDPSAPSIFPSRAAVEDGLSSMSCLNNRYESTLESSQLQDDSREERYWPREQSLDYIPLPEDEELGVDAFPRSLHAWESPNNSKFSIESFPATASTRLHSDTTFKRTSVFSRLSKNPEEASADGRLELDQLVELVTQRRNQWNKHSIAPGDELRFKNKFGIELDVSQRRNQWNKKSIAPRQFIRQGAEQQFNRKNEMGLDMPQGRNVWDKIAIAPRNVISLGDEQQLNNKSAAELDGDGPKFEPDFEVIPDEYFNFKRKNGVLEVFDCETKNMEGNNECGNKEDQKRRKLVRPYFNDQDAFNESNKEHKIDGLDFLEVNSFFVETSIKEGQSTFKISDSVVRCHDDDENMSSGLSVVPTKGECREACGGKINLDEIDGKCRLKQLDSIYDKDATLNYRDGGPLAQEVVGLECSVYSSGGNLGDKKLDEVNGVSETTVRSEEVGGKRKEHNVEGSSTITDYGQLFPQRSVLLCPYRPGGHRR